MALCITMLACGQAGGHSKGSGNSGADNASAKPFRVALLTPGPVSDQAWNGGAYQGLLRTRDSLGALISNVETKTPAEFDDNFRQYGAQGYAVVFGNGFEYQDAAQRVAPAYPHTIYVINSGDRAGANVASLAFKFEDGAYLAGLVAGAMTKTNTIGVIGGTALPPVTASFNAFAAGAKVANPHVKVLTSYIGNWDDVSAGKEQGLAQIAQGADIIFQNADAAGLGIFQAVKESSTDTHPVYIFGANSDQNSVAPTVTLGSVIIDLPHAFLMVAREVHDGTFTPRVITLGAKEQVIKLVLNPALASRIPPATVSAVDSVERLLAAGNFQPPTT